MPVLSPLEPGVMFWAGGDPAATIRELKSLGVRCGQMGVPGHIPMDLASAAAWRAVLDQEDFALLTVFAAYNGEDYADGPTIERTVGWIPPATRAERLKRTFDLSDFAAALGAPSIALHVGFVPEDRSDAGYIAVREMTRLVCDYAARHRQSFALETGQEPARVLLAFMREVDRSNLKINFDPANLILYGTGDPIEAVPLLGPHIVSVHAKDGKWPPRGVPGALGTETRLGEGDVGLERFIAGLREAGYSAPLNIEREGTSPEQRLEDIRLGVALLRRLVER